MFKFRSISHLNYNITTQLNAHRPPHAPHHSCLRPVPTQVSHWQTQPGISVGSTQQVHLASRLNLQKGIPALHVRIDPKTAQQRSNLKPSQRASSTSPH